MRGEPDGDAVMKVGVVGIGKMGRPIAARLITAGHDVAICNRSDGAVQFLRSGAALHCGIPQLNRDVAQLHVFGAVRKAQRILERAMIVCHRVFDGWQHVHRLLVAGLAEVSQQVVKELHLLVNYAMHR